VFLCLLAHVEVDHGADGVDVNQEHALCVAHLGKVIQEGKVLHQVLAVGPHAMLQLNTGI